LYPNVQLHIAGKWRNAEGDRTLPVINPSTEEQIGTVAYASCSDLDEALEAAARGFELWKKTSAFDRSKIMRRAAELMRERVESIAMLMTLEQGKPLFEARTETKLAADIIEWCAEEARRTYGRIVPARSPDVYQLVLKEPVGPVAAFTPWNFPINQVVRKLSAALAAGCSIIIKAPEETPASPAELVRAFVDAGVPEGVIGLVYGVPSEISEYLIPHPVIRKLTFTGSTPVGKQLAALAGAHMKRITMELGGHAPAVIFEDADVDAAVQQLIKAKFRNAGQVCVAPTRFLVQTKVYEEFVGKFVKEAKTIKVADGLEKGVSMGPMANERRITAMESLLADGRQKGAEIQTGGNRIGNKGYFFEPTIVTNVNRDMRMMNEEPFGPLAMVLPFASFEEAVTEANRLDYGLASYAYTGSTKTATRIAQSVEAGMMTINQLGLALPEVPFGGMKDSGYGSEGGSEAIEAYLTTKFVSQAGF